MKSHTIGALIVILILVGAIMVGGSYKLFINVPSFIFVFGIVLGGLIFRFGFGGLSLICSNSKSRVIYCRYGKNLSLLAGFLGTVTGLVQCFAQIEDVGKASEAFGLCFVSLFYGFLLSLIFLMLEKDPSQVETD